MFTSDTNRAQRILRLLQAAEKRGLERQRLLAAIGLDEDQISDPDDRVPAVKTVQLWQLLAEQIEEPDLGLEVGTTLRIKEAGVVGYAMMYSDDLLGALRRMVRFAKLVRQRLELGLEREGDTWRLFSVSQPLLPGFRPPIDEGLAGLVTAFREIAGRDILPAGIHFTYRKPPDVSRHREVFGSRLSFGAEVPAILLWHRDVTASSIAADATLTRYLDDLAQIRLEALPRAESYSERVRQSLWPHLSEGLPSIQQIAGELALSTRSLQRRLREEATNYATVAESLRKDKARLLLRDRHLAVYEVGYLLGYSDPSAFYRAFRRWHGVSPSQFRSQLASGL
jgi:AraC-like DNA-binding protein